MTHPRHFRSYLLEQLEPLVAEYGAEIEVDVSSQEIPYPYVLERVDDLGTTRRHRRRAGRPFPHARCCPLVGDEVADGQWEVPEGEPRPLALFDAVRVDYSLRRLVHYTGSDWRNVQQWILLTNYHRYVDQFVRWGLASSSRAEAPTSAGAARRRRDRARRAPPKPRRGHRRQLPGTASRCRPIT